MCSYWFFIHFHSIPNTYNTDSGLPPFGRDDNGMGDDRIAHILSEASGMMKPSLGGPLHNQNDDSHSNDESDSPHNQSPSPFSKELRRSRKYESDDISREKMSRIYQEELAKLITRDHFPRWVNSVQVNFISISFLANRLGC